MLDQNITTLIAVLIGGLTSMFGTIVANHYAQSSLDQLQKKKEIRNLVEQVYKSMQDIKYALRDLSVEIKIDGVQYKNVVGVGNNLDDIERKINLYLFPLKSDFSEYKKNIKRILEKAHTETGTKSTTSVDTNLLKAAEEQFLSSLISLLKKEGYKYF